MEGGSNHAPDASLSTDFPQQWQQQQHKGGREACDSANGMATPAAAPSMTGWSRGAFSPGAGDSDLVGDPEGEELQELLGETPIAASPVHPAVAEVEEYARNDSNILSNKTENNLPCPYTAATRQTHTLAKVMGAIQLAHPSQTIHLPKGRTRTTNLQSTHYQNPP